jgi:hypothetical protein
MIQETSREDKTESGVINDYNILVGKHDRKRPLGKPRRRWEYLAETVREGVDWIDFGSESGPVTGCCGHCALHAPPISSVLIWSFSFHLVKTANYEMQLLIMQFSPTYHHSIPFGSKYSPQHLVLKHPQCVLPLKREIKFHIHTKQQVKEKFYVFWFFYVFR